MCYFFFSSRRRHTRCYRDWSSDVCSSDLVGQLTIGSITWGSARSGQVGYWIDEAYAGRGIIPTTLAMAVDHCFGVVGLHRLEASIRPENHASRRVVEKLGFREDGVRVRELHN